MRINFIDRRLTWSCALILLLLGHAAYAGTCLDLGGGVVTCPGEDPVTGVVTGNSLNGFDAYGNPVQTIVTHTIDTTDDDDESIQIPAPQNAFTSPPGTDNTFAVDMEAQRHRIAAEEREEDAAIQRERAARTAHLNEPAIQTSERNPIPQFVTPSPSAGHRSQKQLDVFDPFANTQMQRQPDPNTTVIPTLDLSHEARRPISAKPKCIIKDVMTDEDIKTCRTAVTN